VETRVAGEAVSGVDRTAGVERPAVTVWMDARTIDFWAIKTSSGPISSR
jgi:hypothetical protein